MKNEMELDAVRRQRLADALVSWLDEVLDADDPPTGIAGEIIDKLEGNNDATDAESDVDWYEVQASLAVLTQETRLQSRAFSKMSDRLETAMENTAPPSRDGLANLISDIGGKLDRLLSATVGDGPSDELPRASVYLLVDIRDRLVTAQDAARQSSEAAEAAFPTWWPARYFVKKSAAVILSGFSELMKGYAIAIDRLDDTLKEAGVVETVRVGDPFNPETMRIMDIEESDIKPEGTVLAIYRRGYRRDTETVRTAEVKVVRRASRLLEK